MKEEIKCQYPECKAKATMMANLYEGEPVQVACCKYHFYILSSGQFSYDKKTKQVIGKIKEVELIESVMAARIMVELENKDGKEKHT